MMMDCMPEAGDKNVCADTTPFPTQVPESILRGCNLVCSSLLRRFEKYEAAGVIESRLRWWYILAEGNDKELYNVFVFTLSGYKRKQQLCLIYVLLVIWRVGWTISLSSLNEWVHVPAWALFISGYRMMKSQICLFSTQSITVFFMFPHRSQQSQLHWGDLVVSSKCSWPISSAPASRWLSAGPPCTGFLGDWQWWGGEQGGDHCVSLNIDAL